MNKKVAVFFFSRWLSFSNLWIPNSIRNPAVFTLWDKCNTKSQLINLILFNASLHIVDEALSLWIKLCPRRDTRMWFGWTDVAHCDPVAALYRPLRCTNSAAYNHFYPEAKVNDFQPFVTNQTLNYNMPQQFISLHPRASPFPVRVFPCLPRLMLTLGLFCYGVDRGTALWPRDTIIRPVFMTAAEMGL